MFFSFSGRRGFSQSILYNFTHHGAWKRLTVYSDFYGTSDGREFFAVEVIGGQLENSVERGSSPIYASVVPTRSTPTAPGSARNARWASCAPSASSRSAARAVSSTSPQPGSPRSPRSRRWGATRSPHRRSFLRHRHRAASIGPIRSCRQCEANAANRPERDGCAATICRRMSKCIRVAWLRA